MNYYLEKAIKLNADGIDFVPMSIGNVPNIIASYTREELENVKGFPKTNYLFYKIVNGRKEYINLDKQKEVVMTRFENIQKMNIEEMAKFFLRIICQIFRILRALYVNIMRKYSVPSRTLVLRNIKWSCIRSGLVKSQAYNYAVIRAFFKASEQFPEQKQQEENEYESLDLCSRNN